MARLAPKIETVKALLARSGNQCAFPDCIHPIINENNKLIAQLCHIEGANKGGERYNPNQNDEQRRSYNNLLFMCYRHHVETNDEDVFTAKIMRDMKESHENQFIEDQFKVIDKAILRQIQEDVTKFWIELKVLHETQNINSGGMNIEIPFEADIVELFGNLRENISGLVKILQEIRNNESELSNNSYKLAQYLNSLGIVSEKLDELLIEKRSFQLDWETLNLAVPNFTQKTSILLDQLEIKLLEKIAAENPRDINVRHRIETLKQSLIDHAKHAIYFD